MPSAAPIRARCGRRRARSSCSASITGRTSDPLAILRERGARRHFGLCPRRRLSRRHQAAAEDARTLADRNRPAATIKVFVDTAPVMEKPLAAAAGLGWQGKHTNLVSRQFGSWLFLGAIFTTLDLPPDAAEQDHCGNCRACLDVCPTAAFPAPYRLDARRCISYLTIEHKGADPARAAPADRQPHLWLRRLPRGLPLEQIRRRGPRGQACGARGVARAEAGRSGARSTMRRFARCSQRAPVKRIGRARFMRNVLIAIGNSGDAALAGRGRTLLDDRFAAGARCRGLGARPARSRKA